MAQTVAAFRYDDGEGRPQASRAGAASISIFADREALLGQLSDHARECGLVLRQVEPLSRLLNGDALVLGDVVMIDAPVVDAQLLAAFARLDMRAARTGSELIVSTTPAGLDGVFGALDQSGAQILVSPGDADRALALGSALARLPARVVRELTGEDRMTLVRLTEQVQLLARKMEGLAVSDESFAEGAATVHSPSLNYMAPAPKAAAPQARRGADLPSPVLVREIIRQRQLRARFFDADLFADPAWDMLLDLTAAKAEGKQVSVSSLCIAACVPPTTALRWIGQMTEAGLLDRVRDTADRRRAFIELSGKASDAMAAYFRRLDNGAAVI